MQYMVICHFVKMKKWPYLSNYNSQEGDIDVIYYVFMVKEFIKMVKQVVDGLINNEIQNGRRFKGKTAEIYYPHYSNHCGVKCYVFGVKEFIKMINQVEDGLNNTKI